LRLFISRLVLSPPPSPSLHISDRLNDSYLCLVNMPPPLLLLTCMYVRVYTTKYIYKYYTLLYLSSITLTWTSEFPYNGESSTYVRKFPSSPIHEKPNTPRPRGVNFINYIIFSLIFNHFLKLNITNLFLSNLLF